MKGTTRLRILVLTAFIAAIALMYMAYTTMEQNLNTLVTSVEQASRPDRQLLRIKELWTTFRSEGNNVRAYSVTRDERYLESFLDSRDHITETIDSLRLENESQGISTADLDSLKSYVIEKAELYEGLLDINYNRVISEAVTKMNIETPQFDTTALDMEDGNVLQRLFSSRYSRKSVQARADSIMNERNARLVEYNRNLKKIREEEARQLEAQSEKELALLQNDATLTASIEALITGLENDERARIANRIQLSRTQALQTVADIRNMIIAGVGIIMLLFVLVLVDIEIAGRRKRELIKARKHAEKLAGAREEFISTMSHEIRTPLTSVIGFTGKLKQTELDAEQERYLKAISGSSNHLLAVVNDVLDYSRIETGKLRFDEISFKPVEIFSEVYDALKWKADEKKIKFNLFAMPLSKITLHGDPVRLRQILFNLAGNAIKFTEKGSVDITGTIVNENENPVLLIKVSDTGIGIAPDKLEKIFEDYEQAESDTERKYGGTGLGLPISRKITQQLGGKIKVESNPGLGTVFSVRIPYKWGEETATETSYTEDIKEKPFAGLTFIIAEDDSLIRELQVNNLEDLGAKVLAATNGKEALQLFKQNHADLILMDIQMPEMTGPEAVRVIRNEFEATKKDVPVIAMTANILQHDLKKYMSEGMNDFITKPFRDSELFEKIGSLLDLKLIAKQEEPAIRKTVAEQTPFLSVQYDQPYDLKELVESSHGNIDFVKKMINLFLTSSFAGVNNLKFHLKQNNQAQLGKTAHRMIGSYKQMGILHIAALLKELENTCTGPPQQGKAAWLVTEIEKYSNEVFELLKGELSKINAG